MLLVCQELEAELVKLFVIDAGALTTLKTGVG